MNAEPAVSDIVLYGGTFSPPHNGHVQAMRAAVEALHPVRAFVIPAAIPPHKRLSSDDDPVCRLEMTRLAMRDLPGWGESLTVSDYEIQKEGVSYTCQTLEHFSALYPRERGYRLNFLCGTDMMLTLDQWKRPETIFALARILLMRRENDRALDDAVREKTADYAARYGAELLTLNAPPLPLSSTEIRQCLRRGDPLPAGLIPAQVLDYIEKKKLYG